MSIRLIQLKDRPGARRVAARVDAGHTRLIEGIASTYELANVALSARASLAATVADRLSGELLDLAQAQSEGRLLAPIDRPDPAHLYLTGTGLTHPGSAGKRAPGAVRALGGRP